MEVDASPTSTSPVPEITAEVPAAASQQEVIALPAVTPVKEMAAISGIMQQQEEEIKDDDCKDEGEYMLRWSEHNTQLIHVFHQLCQADELTDVTIATEGDQFKAHKLVLSACSPYFRQLFLSTPCKHPVVFIKDISDEHMRLLLEYMYRGSIAVKQYELEEILSAASVLKIRGLTTATLPPDHPASGGPTTTFPSAATASSEDEEAPLIVDESVGGDKFHHVETSSSVSGRSGGLRKAEGRKSSVPKKLRLSSGDGHSGEDLDAPHSPPRLHISQQVIGQAGNPWFMQKPGGGVVDSDLRTSPILLGGGRPIVGSTGGSSADNRSPIGTLTDTEEIDADQPVDFSTTNSSGNKIDLAPRYSILGSYLKTGLPGLGDSGLLDPQKRNELAEDLRRAGYGGQQAATWLGLEHLTSGLKQQQRPASRDSRGDSREERNSSGEDNEKDSKGTPPPLGTLTDTLGIDIAGRLRSHFLANLPSQSYAWLNGMSNGNMTSLNSLASMSQLGAMGSLSGLSSLANIPPKEGSNRARRGSSDKIEKHPVGGVRTGEIGANGKPAVACEVCGKKLADPSSLYRHRKIHSGDKPHKCPYCPRRFIQRYNMKQHIKTHRIELMADQTTLPAADSSNFVEHEGHNITT